MTNNQRLRGVSRQITRYCALFFTTIASAIIGVAMALSNQQPVSAHEHNIKVFVGANELNLHNPVYIDHNGTVYAPVDVFQAMGYDTVVNESAKTMGISNWHRAITWPIDNHDGQAMVPLAKVATALDATYSFDSDSNTVTLLANILLVREDSDRLSVLTSFPVPVHTESLDSPNRVFLDLNGAHLSTAKVTIPVSGDDCIAMRAAQTSDSTVRLVVDLKRTMTFKRLANAIPSHYQLQLIGVGGQSGVQMASLPVPIPVSHASNDTALPVSHTPIHTVVVTIPVVTAANVTPEPTSSSTPSTDVSASHIDNIAYSSSSDAFTVTIDVTPGADSASTPYHAFLLDNPDRLAFDIPNADFQLPAALADNASSSLDVSSSIAKRIRWGIADPTATSFGKPAGRIVVDLNQDIEYQVTSDPVANGVVRYTISIPINAPTQVAQGPATAPTTVVQADTQAAQPDQAPTSTSTVIGAITNAPSTSAVTALPAPSTDQSATTTAIPTPSPATMQPVISNPLSPVPDSVLSGKTILVDPGHGGKDTGAPGVHGIYEKDIVLAIAKKLRDDLVACGARVIMTRADDTFIPLVDRSQMGIDYHADYFVSVHADSSGIDNSRSGTTVYYHANNATCRSMAACIAQRFGQLDDGIKSDGVRSDFVRFPGIGFSVLRRSTEPAILVEAGYVDSDNDASHLTADNTQIQIAEGIVAGLKDFAAQGSATASVSHPSAPSNPIGTVTVAQLP